jgi:hypothetical protein
MVRLLPAIISRISRNLVCASTGKVYRNQMVRLLPAIISTISRNLVCASTGKVYVLVLIDSFFISMNENEQMNIIILTYGGHLLFIQMWLRRKWVVNGLRPRLNIELLLCWQHEKVLRQKENEYVCVHCVQLYYEVKQVMSSFFGLKQGMIIPIK